MADFSVIPWIAKHIELYRQDPAAAHMWDSTPLGGPGLLPTLLLTTKGRKSGEPRALPGRVLDPDADQDDHPQQQGVDRHTDGGGQPETEQAGAVSGRVRRG